MARTFEDRPAVRERTPLLIGLVGASGCGKTFSALRLATGIRRVVGGDVFVIDTEARRALAYADHFKFRHLEFGAPFGPLDYLAAVEHCARKGARTVVIDSMSHEHEGPGGVLEMHAAEVRRMAGDDYRKAERVKMLAWQKPKGDRRRLLNTLLQMPINLVFCFRAKEKIKLVSGQEPRPLGWMPIAGEEFIYEMTLNCLLYPASGGVPSWHPEEMGEKAIIKLPVQFRELFAESAPLSEEIGSRLAEWAAGSPAAAEAPAIPAPSGVGFNQWLDERLGRARSLWQQQCRSEGIDPGAEADLCKREQAIQGLATAALEAGRVAQPAEGKRTLGWARSALSALWNDGGAAWLDSTLTAYLARKHSEACAKLGMDFDPENESQEAPDDSLVSA